MVADNHGTVKGYVDYPYADLPSRKDGKLDVGSLVGNQGSITVIMDYGLKEPMWDRPTSIRENQKLATYALSEQQPSAVGLGV